MKRRMMTFLLAVSACALLAGCKKDAAPKEDTSAKKETTTKKDDNHDNDAKSPLTGEWIDAELAEKRPVAVMISNIKDALPQYGTKSADVIYECPVEGGITRMMAIYQDYSGLERIGSVRSCRLYFPKIANEFEAIYVHFGQSDFALPYLDGGNIDNLNGIKSEGSEVFYRTDDKKPPHNAFTSEKGINAGIKKKNYETQLSSDYTGHYTFAEDGKEVELKNGEDAVVVQPGYSVDKPWFVYDKKEGVYKRYEYGTAQKDAAVDKQLTFKNVLIQCCSWQYESDKYTLNIDVNGGGSGYYITNGKAIPVTWKKDSANAPARYYDADGNEITMNQGKTWVCVVQDSYADKIKFYSSEDDFKAAK